MLKISLLFYFTYIHSIDHNVVLSQSVHDTSTSIYIDKTTLDTRVKELNYDKTKTIIKLKEIKFEENNRVEKESTNIKGLPQLILRILTYCLVAFLILLIVYFLYKDYVSKNINLETKFDQNEDFEIENIESLSIDPILQTALSEGNYRFSIRLMFLKILQILQDKKLIKWKKDKTNHAYVQELNSDYKNEFIQLINIFDKVWYGNTAINKAQYDKVVAKFDQFINLFVK